MKKENLTIIKFKDSLYGNVIQNMDEDVIYCELEYQRDRGSFAGVVFKVTNDRNIFVARECQEKIVEEVNKYEKMYIGCDKDYVDSLKDIFSLEERVYGIEMCFLVYSDVRSSQIIFEDLMKKIDENINEIKIEMNN